MSSSKWGTSSRPSDEEVKQRMESFISMKDEGVLIQGKNGVYLPDFTPRVRAGMDLLDFILPGWHEEIDLSSLNLEDDQQCVLGQSWPLYARVHDLLDKSDGDYKEFANALLSVGGSSSDDRDRNNFAASIGCALSAQDTDLINVQLTDADFFAMASRAIGIKISIPTMAQFWEALTTTWIAEIIKARVDGRWAPKLTVEELDHKIDEAKEVSVTT